MQYISAIDSFSSQEKFNWAFISWFVSEKEQHGEWVPHVQSEPHAMSQTQISLQSLNLFFSQAISIIIFNFLSYFYT